ncbi:MAG: hypothetical protein M3Z05_09210 [Gemmatimonadota bacterium]|nr:hypothetical protein [Gemmatimonadota bacterium]
MTSPTELGLRVLLDESVPNDLLLQLTGFDAVTVQSLGWAGMKNGVLLRAAGEAGFQVLVTVDRRLEYQQNIPKSGLGLIVLQARSTRMPDLLPLVPALRAALPSTRAGEVVHVAV